jgi:parvulin-like peptidyl-prolyl isomerase
MTNYPLFSDAAVLQQAKLMGLIPGIRQEIITRQIIETQAQEMNLEVTIEELQAAADAMRTAQNLHSAEATMNWLTLNGLEQSDFETMITTSVLSSKVAEALFSDQVESYFQEHYWDFVQIVFYEIILEDEDVAWELFYGLQEGELNFHAIAHQYIQDPELRRRGGYQKLLRTDVRPEIVAIALTGELPTIIKPFLSSQGLHLVLLQELCKPTLHADLQAQIMGKLFSIWLRQRFNEVGSSLNGQGTQHKVGVAQ